MRNKLALSAVFIIILAVGIWVFMGQKKDVNSKIQWSVDEQTKETVPVFYVFYKWDGVEENDPTWMIFPKEDKWWVVDIRDIKNLSEVQSYRQEFTKDWIHNHKFNAKGTRYEILVMAFGFQNLFNAEKDAFSQCDNLVGAFKIGIFHPDGVYEKD